MLTLTELFPAGTFIVPTAQYLGRLVAHMLEPETEDNVVYWNTMDAWIPRSADAVGGGRGFRGRGAGTGSARPPLVPIYKLMTPTALTTKVMGN